ncbi:hypothetical protein KO529_10035 [Arenibacter algicola]|uniref:hypothetical protein n=1 Tax=Arenibacter algicola TaxID=616991 RepID=UPI001C06A09F|nr:hypothetical protein [Arenibacter algicola]MBU2905123.1 hypothetical protein [Arenibacter algicola]
MTTLETWKEQVLDYNTSLNDKLRQNEIAKSLYYGFKVIDGKLIDKPDILFVGINPGMGNKTRHYSVQFDNERISYLDKYNDDYRVDYPRTYHLAEKTIKFFEQMKWSNVKIIDLLENKVVKTNFYHIATNNGNDINKTVNQIENGFHHSYFQKSAEFTLKLIEIIKPKLVILEGKKVYDDIVVQCCGQKDTWKTDKFGDCFDKKLNTHFIGYDRTFSNDNRAVFVARLQELLNKE